MAKKTEETIRLIQNGWSSRKYRAAWYLTTIILLLSLVSWSIIIYMGLSIDHLFISGSAALTFIGTIWSIYFSANVAQKFTSVEKGRHRHERIQDICEKNPEI